MSDFGIETLGEDAVLLRVAQTVSSQANARVHAIAAAIATQRPPWLREIVPAYASLALFVDPDHPEARQASPATLVGDWLRATGCSEASPAVPGNGGDDDSSIVEIPTCYEGDCAPDLVAVAAHARLPPEEVVARHVAATCVVAMIGFAPGFPYLLGLDPALAMPRRATPRVRVPAGSVAIGGAQTGIYPRESPGGWQLIGRTPLQLFDPARAQPSLLRPGQRVRFRQIDSSTFSRMARDTPHD